MCGQGMDISEAMLDVALDREVEGDLCVSDLGQGLPFRTGTFDGAISISAVQWLCNAVRTLPSLRIHVHTTISPSLAPGKTVCSILDVLHHLFRMTHKMANVPTCHSTRCSLVCTT